MCVLGLPIKLLLFPQKPYLPDRLLVFFFDPWNILCHLYTIFHRDGWMEDFGGLLGRGYHLVPKIDTPLNKKSLTVFPFFILLTHYESVKDISKQCIAPV